jgi:hypothetical protein
MSLSSKDRTQSPCWRRVRLCGRQCGWHSSTAHLDIGRACRQLAKRGLLPSVSRSPLLEHLQEYDRRLLDQHGAGAQATRRVDNLAYLSAHCMPEIGPEPLSVVGGKGQSRLVTLIQSCSPQQRADHQHTTAQRAAHFLVSPPYTTCEARCHPHTLRVQIAQDMPAHGEHYCLRSMVALPHQIASAGCHVLLYALLSCQ